MCEVEGVSGEQQWYDSDGDYDTDGRSIMLVAVVVLAGKTNIQWEKYDFPRFILHIRVGTVNVALDDVCQKVIYFIASRVQDLFPQKMQNFQTWGLFHSCKRNRSVFENLESLSIEWL